MAGHAVDVQQYAHILDSAAVVVAGHAVDVQRYFDSDLYKYGLHVLTCRVHTHLTRLHAHVDSRRTCHCTAEIGSVQIDDSRWFADGFVDWREATGHIFGMSLPFSGVSA